MDNNLSEDELDVISKATLDRLLRMSKISVEFAKVCDNEYYRRFRKIIGYFVTDIDTLSLLMLVTESYISGSMTMLFMFPDYFDSESVEDHDLDLYIAPRALVHVVTFLVYKENFDLICQHDMKPNGIPYELGARSGIDKVLNFRRGRKRIDVVVSAKENAVYPILHFHFTAPMNVLSPNCFMSFYATYTLEKKAIFNETAFENNSGQEDYGRRVLKERARRAYEKYEARGFIVKELPDFVRAVHPSNCLTSKCRQIRYTDDPATLRLDFGPYVDQVHHKSTFNEPVIRWCLGGYYCGLVALHNCYTPFFVQIL